MSTPSSPRRESPVFDRAVAALRAARTRAEVRLTDVPAPQRIAPFALAMTGDVVSPRDPDTDLATGRFVLLHDPDEPEPWEGTWRIVTFARADLEPEMAADPLLADIGWAWLEEALAANDASYVAPGGTVTRVVSESFGALADREDSISLEVRASWTPTGDDLEAHLGAWVDLLCELGGLPPLPEGVIALPGPKR